jgi:hypothetical protein
VACPALIDPACVVGSIAGKAASAAAGSAANGAMAGIASAIQSGIAWVVSSTVDWWVQVPSPDLAADPAVGALQRWMLPVTVAIAVLAMLAAAGKMALTRKANPLIDVGSGLAIIAATSAVGVLLPSMLLKAGDAWSSWILATSTGGQFGARLTALLTLPEAGAGVVLVLGIVAIILTAVQAVLMLFRQAALVVLAGVLPLAAAGTLTPATRAWFRRVTGWMLALIFYKPAAAAVYATAFTMIGTGNDPRTTLMGFAMVLMSLLALPVLMKFFTWTTGSIEASAGGGGFLSTLMSGAVAIGAVRASAGGIGGSSAADQARMMSAQLGPQGGRTPQGAGPGGASPAAAPATASPGTGAGPSATGSGPGPTAARSAPAGAAGGRAATAGAGPGGAAGSGSTAGEAAGSAAAGAGPGAAAGGAGAAAGTVAGPAGAAAAGLASGAAQAGRHAADAIRLEDLED